MLSPSDKEKIQNSTIEVIENSKQSFSSPLIQFKMTLPSEAYT
jgi:hypothetical protein